MNDNQQFQAIAQYLQGSAPSLYLEIDSEGIVKSSNSFTTKMLGRDISGIHFQEIFVDSANTVTPEEFAKEPNKLHRFSISTYTGLPQDFQVCFIPAHHGTTIIGSIDSQRSISCEKKIHALNQERSVLSRELQESNAKLENLSKQNSRFLSSINHDVRTPLNGINGFAELLRQEFYGPLNSKQMEYVKNIESSGKYLLDLINDLLKNTKIESGAIELEVEELDLDLLLQTSDQEPEETSLQDEDHPITSHRILVVDDNHTNRILMENLLSVHHHEVTLAKNGKEAIEMCLHARPELIFMDIVMPEMDGLEAIQEIKNTTELENVPIIALTAQADAASIRETIQAGCNAHLTKPINSKEIFLMIHRFLGSNTNPQP